MSIRGYDAWKLASPDEDRPDPEFFCNECEDAGCPECCETQPITLEDLDQISEQQRWPMTEFTNIEKRAAAMREVGYRQHVYAGLVQKGKMSPDDADRGIAIMREIAADYGELVDKDMPPLPLIGITQGGD